MHLTTQEVAVQHLEIGMYVSRLDVPWVQTPFPIQGFYITKQEEISLISHYCNKVYIDVFLSQANEQTKLQSPKKATIRHDKSNADAKTAQLMKEKARFKPRVKTYQSTKKLAKEMKVASQLFEQVTEQMAAVYRAMEQNGYINFDEVSAASQLMVTSIINNPNALAWICRVNNESQTLYQQSVRSSVWALIFARHLGLAQSDLKDLGTAMLLSTIGKNKLPKELLTIRIGAAQESEYQQHIQLTLDETCKMFSKSHQVNYILSAYCERNNGCGYPAGLVGNKIPFLARIAGIADYYEQLINPYDTTKALSPAEAISHLYSLRGETFQTELVEAFIQSIGLYPTGSLIQLNNNAVGVVIEQKDNTRLRPRVAIIRDSHDNLMEKPQTIDLSVSPHDDSGIPLQIEKSMLSTAHEIDGAELHNRLFGKKAWYQVLAS